MFTQTEQAQSTQNNIQGLHKHKHAQSTQNTCQTCIAWRVDIRVSVTGSNFRGANKLEHPSQAEIYWLLVEMAERTFVDNEILIPVYGLPSDITKPIVTTEAGSWRAWRYGHDVTSLTSRAWRYGHDVTGMTLRTWPYGHDVEDVTLRTWRYRHNKRWIFKIINLMLIVMKIFKENSFEIALTFLERAKYN